MSKILAIAALLWLAAACTQRAAPYRFRGPVVSGVHAAALPPPGDRATPMEDGSDVRSTKRNSRAARLAADRPTHSPDRARSKASRASDRGGPLAGTLRAMVGLREREATPLSFALSALSTLGADLDEGVRDLPNASALVAFARPRGATSSDRDVLLGDLVIFEDIRRKGKKRSAEATDTSAIGVVVAVDPEGTIELIYLARGIIRRGYMTLARAHEKRDARGRVLNTIVRQAHGNGRKGRTDLTGERFSIFVHLDGLSAH